MSLLPYKDLIEGLVGPISELIDELHVSVEEKANLKNQIYAKAIQLTETALAYEQNLFKSKADIIIAEAQGASWLQRNWRPVLMLTFGFMLVWNWVVVPLFGATPIEFPNWVGTLMTAGVGGYIVGRSAEKIATSVSLNQDLLRTPGESQRDLKAWRKMLKAAKTPEERERILDAMAEDA